jgi:IclR family transcriptional regulator, KDG regulon repressor
MDSPSVKTIDRLVQVLDYFTEGHETASLAELSAFLCMPKSTLHRFLVGLDSHGILRHTPDKKWRLGYRLLAWGSAAGESTSLREMAHPFLAELVRTCGETALLTVYQNHQVVCIDMVETSQPIRLMTGIGVQRAAHAGASSKVLIAYLPEEEIEAIVADKGLPRLCKNTITDPSALTIELASIRARGYADSLEETDAGAWGVATPIRDGRGQVVAAVGIAGPTTRYHPEKVESYAEQCGQAAAKISAVLSISR